MDVPLELIQQILHYLGGRPWVEVNDMLVQLVQLVKPEEPPDGE